MNRKLRRLLRDTDRRLRAADTPGDIRETFERFTEDVTALRDRLRRREERRRLAHQA
jgi:hypothetical protein